MYIIREIIIFLDHKIMTMKSIENKLLEWINKTGYPLEIYAESILSANGFKNENSYIYYDEKNQISRELDILAYKDWNYNPEKPNKCIYCTITLLIECKKSTKPFILLQSRSNSCAPYNIKEIIYSDDYMCLAILQKGFPCKIPITTKDKRGFKLIQGFTDSDETIHKAMNTLIKSFDYEAHRLNHNKEDYTRENSYNIIIPILLIDAPFYCLQLDQNENISITELKHGIVNQPTTLKESHETFPILITTKQQLQLCIQSIDIYGQRVVEYLKSNPKNNLANV